MKQLLLLLLLSVAGFAQGTVLNPSNAYPATCLPGQIRSRISAGTVTTKYCNAAGTGWTDIDTGSGGAGDLVAANNLSDVADTATARTNLGLAIGTNVQAYDADLTTYAGITPSANVQTLLGAADFAAFKTSLSLGNVENTALSTWAGTTNITTLGTLSATTISSTSANALAVGANGTTNPVLMVNANTASVATGIEIVGAAAAATAGASINVISSGTNENMTLAPRGTGQILIPQGTAAGPSIAFTGATTTGIFGTSAGVQISRAGTASMYISNTRATLPAASIFSWGSGADPTGLDTGLARPAAKVIRATDGSTGAGSFVIGTSSHSIGTSGVSVLAIGNGTIPSSSPADEVQLYAEDVTSSSELKVRDEAGNIATLSPHNPHSLALFQAPADDPAVPWAGTFTNVYAGKTVHVDMLTLAREVERLGGKQIIFLEDLPADKIRDWDADEEEKRLKRVAEQSEWDAKTADEKANSTRPVDYVKREEPKYIKDRKPKKVRVR